MAKAARKRSRKRAAPKQSLITRFQVEDVGWSPEQIKKFREAVRQEQAAQAKAQEEEPRWREGRAALDRAMATEICGRSLSKTTRRQPKITSTKQWLAFALERKKPKRGEKPMQYADRLRNLLIEAAKTNKRLSVWKRRTLATRIAELR